MIDSFKNYKKMILVCFPSYTGGKFLINCLSLGPESVFQHQDLAQRQIDGTFSYSDKIQYLHDQLSVSEQTQVWTDLNLTTTSLLQIDTTEFCTQYHEILAYQMSPVITEIMHNDLHMFMCAHSSVWIDAYLKFWPNAKVICFVNYKNFRNSRQQAPIVPYQKSPDRQTGNGYRSNSGEWVFLPKHQSGLPDYWNTVRGPDWPVEPPTNFQELEALPEFVRHELKGQFKNYILNFFNYQELYDQLFDKAVDNYQQTLGDRCYIWDVQKGFENGHTGFLSQFEQCRNWLGVSPVNHQDLAEYFDRWLQIVSNNSSNQGD